MSLKPIDQQVVVIMGASSGIGRLAALEFAHRGAQVLVSARSEEGLNSLVDQIRRDGGEATAITADVADFSQVKAVAETAVGTYGRLDTWVHLAAVSIYASFEETTPEEFQQVIQVNLLGQIHGAKAALPYLRREGQGALIHVSSIEGVRTLPFQAAYGASKHGVVGFLEALRLELQHEGLPISVTNIMPASINTPLFNKARTKLGVKPQGLPPVYEPEVVVRAILHAAEHPTPYLYAGGAAKMIGMMQSFSPQLMDLFLRWTAFKGQKTNDPKPEEAPDNLYGPISGFDRIQGDFGSKAMSVSPYTQAETNTGLMAGLAGVAIGAVLALASRKSQETEKESYRTPVYYR